MATPTNDRPRGAFRGIVPAHLLDRPAEWHALVQGFCEVLCPWPPREKIMHAALRAEICDEHHYYMLGRTLGLLAWLTIVLILAHLISGMVPPATQIEDLAPILPVP